LAYRAPYLLDSSRHGSKPLLPQPSRTLHTTMGLGKETIKAWLGAGVESWIRAMPSALV
jgi:hypothetical protein